MIGARRGKKSPPSVPGLVTTFADVYKFMRFAEMFVDHYLA